MPTGTVAPSKILIQESWSWAEKLSKGLSRQQFYELVERHPELLMEQKK